jgi:hypothetical protein
MIILIVGGSYMPAFIQCSGIVFIGTKISGASDSTFPIADLNETDQFIRFFIIICKIIKITKGRTRVIKLGDGIGYKYPHDYENGYVVQQYLPANLRSRHYYIPTERGYERNINQYLQKIKATSAKD